MKTKLKSVEQLTKPASFKGIMNSFKQSIEAHSNYIEFMKTHEAITVFISKPSRYMVKKYGWMEAGKRAAYRQLHSIYSKTF